MAGFRRLSAGTQFYLGAGILAGRFFGVKPLESMKRFEIWSYSEFEALDLREAQVFSLAEPTN